MRLLQGDRSPPVAHLLPVGMTIDPRKVAELASIAVAFEMPEEE